jgi:hypothetical protein
MTTINTLLKQVEKELQDLDKISGLKKKISKYNDLSKQLKHCQNETNKLTIEVKNIANAKVIDHEEENNTDSDEQNIKPKIEMSDVEYDNLIKEIAKLKESINENMSVEDLIKSYKMASENIQKCEEFLKNKKLELINIE